MLRKFFLVLALAFASSAWAGVRTVTLSLPSMYCEMCPATVKKALSKVPQGAAEGHRECRAIPQR